VAALNGSPASGDDLRALALVNYSHFTSMRIEPGGGVRGLELHLNRLERDCREVFGAELDTSRIRELVRKAIDEASLLPITVRVTVFDPNLEMGHPGHRAEPDALVTVRPAVNVPLPPLKATAVKFSRELPHVKHGGLMASLHCRRAAQLAGFDDALFVGPDGNITEGVTWNVGFIDGDQVVWPAGPVLPGITARLVSESYPETATARVHVDQLRGMAAAFATNVSIGVRPIASIDGVRFETEHPLLAELSRRYLEIPPTTV